MTKSDIVDAIADATGLTKVETEEVVDGFMKIISWTLERDESVELRGFGTYFPKERAARMARNPKTGEPVAVPIKFVPVFKPSKEFKDRVDQGIKARRGI